MLKVIIFDADGVLLNQERFSDSFSRDFGVPLRDILPFFQGPFRDCLIGRRDLKEAISPFLPKWQWVKGVDALLRYWFEREHNLNKELIKYIQDLRYSGVICLLATDNEKHRFAYMLERLGFSKSFDQVYASSHIGHSKVNQNFFKKIFEKLPNTDKKGILFVDDDVENIKSAQNFGIHTELYTNLENLKKKISSLNKES